jgi:phosphoglycerate dehydrogenase-like enzyme
MEIPAMTKIGLSSDLFDTKGRPVFDPAAFDLFTEAGLSWTVLPPDGGTIDPASVADYDALFIGGSRLTEASLASDSGVLRVVARNGVGFDAVDLQALTRRGILLTNTPLAVRHSVATIALAFILALSLRIPLKSRLAREGRWAERGDFPGVGLPGRTLGIVGLGGIGRELVRLAQPFGMRVIGADPFVARDQLSETSVELLPLEEVLAQSDFVVIACLLDKTTRHLIDAPRIALMKPTALIINVARGPIIDEAALIDALRAGALAGAGLDVFEQEPPDRNNPLFSLENVIATPHSLCWTDTFLAGVARSAIKSIVDAVEGRLPEHIVNRAAIDHPRVKQWLASASARG